MEGGVPALLYAPNFLELRRGELRRIPLPRTPVNKQGEGLLVPELPEGGAPGLWPRIGA